jgi:hypothetical protein
MQLVSPLVRVSSHIAALALPAYSVVIFYELRNLF